MPHFNNPAAFVLILLIPLLYILRRLKIFKRLTITAVLADWNGKVFEWKGKSQNFFSSVAKVLFWLAFLCVVAALAEPVITKQEKIYTNANTDILFVVDTSPSMAARDMDGTTRMDAVKNTVKQMARQNEGIRYGIVALGDEASVFLPPTGDFSAFLKKIDELKVGILGNGSAIGDGLSTAVCHLVPSSAQQKCIILLTDGENNAGEIHPETAAELAFSNGIRIYVVGTGTKGIVPLEYTDPLTGKNYSGNLDSNFNSASLKRIAQKAQGSYIEAGTYLQLETILNSIAKSENVTQNFIYRTIARPLYSIFLFAGLILIAAVWILKRVFLKEVL
ncbi:MAG: VWA domain-containing protein [Treponema sp.]|nr:VWA domain-containing protein [Treponema sp.]